MDKRGRGDTETSLDEMGGTGQGREQPEEVVLRSQRWGWSE